MPVPLSDHPNPWRVPSPMERLARVHNPYRIYRGLPTHANPQPMVFERLTLGTQMTGFFIKGGIVGFLYGMFDVLYVSGIKNPRAQIARGLYFAAPVAAMGLSIPTFKSCLSALSVYNGGGAEDVWTYALTPAAPALILSYYSGKTVSTAVPLFVLGTFMMVSYRLSMSIGPLIDHGGTAPLRTSSLEPFGDYRIGKESKILGMDTEGPSWKQFLNKDK
ncbi:hypothetical protein TCAL_15054 [Tigriopus californicus]|uniref:Transmembrane protein n=1 Tax=Tigriopus californicus TaxID=6832 RepID=A0A553NZ30_TIGCA|nr:hypothetical protein TCAL_15054 [Tigriopus californicus]